MADNQTTDNSDTGLTNVEVFNLVAAAIFARLYEDFPIPIRLVPESLAKEVLGEDRYSQPAPWDGVHPLEWWEKNRPLVATTEGMRYSVIAHHSITWLQECGFINYVESTTTGLGVHVLSPKGFEALAAIPASLAAKDKKSLGRQVVVAAAAVRDQATTAIISDIIGQIIGAARRSLLGAHLPQ